VTSEKGCTLGSFDGRKRDMQGDMARNAQTRIGAFERERPCRIRQCEVVAVHHTRLDCVDDVARVDAQNVREVTLTKPLDSIPSQFPQGPHALGAWNDSFDGSHDGAVPGHRLDDAPMQWQWRMPRFAHAVKQGTDDVGRSRVKLRLTGLGDREVFDREEW
jgi:hypothetical protein